MDWFWWLLALTVVGGEVVARWREAGRWWEGERPREVSQVRDRSGVKRELVRELPAFGTEPTQREDVSDHREDYDLRPRKLRDEKVALACGYEEAGFSGGILGGASGGFGGYSPLHVMSGYSFGRSLLFARELPRRAAALGLGAVGLTDWFSLAGAMEFSREARDCGVKPLVGSVVEMEEGGHLVLIAESGEGYRRLSRLLTECHLGEERLFPLCNWGRLEAWAGEWVCLTGGDGGLLNLPLMRRDYGEAERLLDRLVGVFGGERVFVEIERSFLPWERMVNGVLLEMAERRGLVAVAGGAVTHGERGDFPAQDVLVCAETLCLVEELVGRKPVRGRGQRGVAARPARALNGERFFRGSREMGRLFGDRLDLLENTWRVVERVEDWVMPGRAELPVVSDCPERDFVEAVRVGAEARYGEMPRGLKLRLGMEINRIVDLGYAAHFLVAWEVCEWARGEGILFSGRGSVVDSVVAYCLGMSRIDAWSHRLHFDRFLPADGSKRPDIDLDFEARRRDDVRNHMVERFGKENVATVGAFGAYCSRGIIREVGKALGLSSDAISFLAKRTHRGVAPDQIESALEKRPELRQAGISKERLHWVFRLAGKLMDVPRNLRAHSSGVVVCGGPVADFVPVTWSAGGQDDGVESTHLRMMQWDKRSAKHCFDKYDILCLRGQDVLGGTQERLRVREAGYSVESAPLDDEGTYRTMRSGHLVGIPQSASPAMRQAHMRIKTANLADASLVQAGIRPGVGGAVKMNELIARRSGAKVYQLEHPDLEPILGHTYGIVVFQEQIDQLLQVFAGYSGGEAEDIRDAIHKRRKEDFGSTIREELLSRIRGRGYSERVADHVFELVAAFKGYGFAQGHALAFAEISVRSIYLQQHYPAEYFAALLDAQPAGYYGPCTLANEARNRGVEVLPVCVERSGLGWQVEAVRSLDDPQIWVPSGGIRVSLGEVSGVSRAVKERTVGLRGDGFGSFFEYVRRVRPARDELERLVLCGAFDGLEGNRRALLWAVPDALAYAASGGGGMVEVPEPVLDRSVGDFSLEEKDIRERQILGLDIRRHLMWHERERARSGGAITTSAAQGLGQGETAYVVGNPIRLRFPPTPSGKRVVFFDLEDETGLLNVTCFDRVYQLDGPSIVCSPYVTVFGEAQWRDGHMAFLARRVFVYRPVITALADRVLEELPVASSDFLVG